MYGLIADPGSIASHLDTIANPSHRGAIQVFAMNDPPRLAGWDDTGFGFLNQFYNFAMDRQLGDQRTVRCVEYCLWGEGEAELFNVST